MKNAGKLRIAVMLLSTLTTTLNAQIVYSASSGFDSAANPSSEWSYRAGGNPISSPTSGNLFGLDYVGWTGFINLDPSVLKFNDGNLYVHSSRGPTYTSIQWNSPFAGYLSISGSAWDGFGHHESFGRNSEWVINVGDVTYARSENVIGLQKESLGANFENNLVESRTLSSIPITEGEKVEFLTRSLSFPFGGFGTGGFVGVELNLTVSPVPEPESIAFGTCLILLSVGACHRLLKISRNPIEGA